jgi:hypothetical protein
MGPMNDDAMNAASPLWARVARMTVCLMLAGVIAWRGAHYDPPNESPAVPFVMCQLAAVVFALLGLLNLDVSEDVGPS